MPNHTTHLGPLLVILAAGNPASCADRASSSLKILEPMRPARALDDVRRFFEGHERKGAVA